MIDHVFYNPVESYSRGHPCTPRKFLPFTPPPPHPLGISIDHPGGGMDIFWNHTISF